MLLYILRRLLLGVLTVLVISVFTFFIIQLPPGDIVEKYLEQTACGNLGDSCILDESTKEAMQKYFGVYEPMTIRYFKWMWHLVQGDMGVSFVAGEDIRAEPIKEVIADRIFMTVALTGFTVLVTWTFAVPVGIYSAVRQHSVGDYVFTFLGFSGLAIPDFLLGLVLMYLAFAYFDQSVGGLLSSDMTNEPWSVAKVRDLIAHLWLPAIVLGTSGTASLIRIMRNNLLDELGKPYVVTAKARGAIPWRLVLKYPVRVAINPLISTVGYLLPSLVSGSVIVSIVLSLPTLGPVLLIAIRTEDTNTAGFIILMLGILTVIGTLVSDLLLAVVDPRIKLTNR
jgi:peptide/nickel transport system permease protein